MSLNCHAAEFCNDVSTSEREMMCSMTIRFFTPSPTREERSNPEITSTTNYLLVKHLVLVICVWTVVRGRTLTFCHLRAQVKVVQHQTSDIENSTNSFGSGQGQGQIPSL
ncbi:hypothetical protein KUTeg_014816 [Tegillarca granosa]|uniref:Uncharacterized protein n=1 Tax=Tegillarca granosa TaxID=220873 RepID=A0ABQ9ER38_TEGGR|nr:hypothetical protein KUTeg_014816 [Tegillarca granosa]